MSPPPAVDMSRLKQRLLDELCIRPPGKDEKGYLRAFSRNILLSGPAGSGKTTLTEELHEALSACYVIVRFSPLLYGGTRSSPEEILASFLRDLLASYEKIALESSGEKARKQWIDFSKKFLKSVKLKWKFKINADIMPGGVEIPGGIEGEVDFVKLLESLPLFYSAMKETARSAIHYFAPSQIPEATVSALEERLLQPNHPMFLRILVWCLYSQIVNAEYQEVLKKGCLNGWLPARYCGGQYMKTQRRAGILVVVDDLDRCRPEQALAILDGMFRYFLFWEQGVADQMRSIVTQQVQQGKIVQQDKAAQSKSKTTGPTVPVAPCEGEPDAPMPLVPMCSLWLLDGAVMEQMFRKEYKDIPDYSIDTYLLQIFQTRVNMPLLTCIDREAPRLWQKALAPHKVDPRCATPSSEEKKCTPDQSPPEERLCPADRDSSPPPEWTTCSDLQCALSRCLNYNILKNIRLYERLIDHCRTYWIWYCPKGDNPPHAELVYEARAILLGLAFFEFRNQVVLHPAWWPPFINVLNNPAYTDVVTAGHHVFRFVSDHNLLTLLADMGAIRYQTETRHHCWESIPAGQERLRLQSIELLRHGF